MSERDSIFISAGDPSADFPGKLLIDQIKRTCPEIEVVGLGGPLMQQSGLNPIADHKQLAVMGFWEVAPKYFFFRRLMKDAVSIIEKRKPKAVILVDYPGFNLRLARKIKQQGIPIIYYISPQVWAWGKNRIKAIKELIDLMLVIFPFEVDFYREHGVEARFVGHPIVERFASLPDRDSCRKQLGTNTDEKLIALLPGSRRQEIKRMLPVMVGASRRINSKLDKTRFMIGAVDDIDDGFYRKFSRSENVELIREMTPVLINAADFVITSSGTATVEIAYLTRPMLVIYKTGMLTYQIARRLVTLNSVGMVNIIAGERIVPELLQREATPEAIASQSLQIITDNDRYNRMIEDLRAVRDKLSREDMAGNAYQAIEERVHLC